MLPSVTNQVSPGVCSKTMLVVFYLPPSHLRVTTRTTSLVPDPSFRASLQLTQEARAPFRKSLFEGIQAEDNSISQDKITIRKSFPPPRPPGLPQLTKKIYQHSQSLNAQHNTSTSNARGNKKSTRCGRALHLLREIRHKPPATACDLQYNNSSIPAIYRAWGYPLLGFSAEETGPRACSPAPRAQLSICARHV